MYYDAKECGDRLRKQIRAAGYTQMQFAEKTHIGFEQLKCILRGTRGFSLDTLVEISCVLNVSTDFILLGYDRERVEVRNKLMDVIADLSEVAKKL